MGKGSSGHKMNNSKKRNRATYKAEARYEVNKKKKAVREEKKQQRLLLKGKGVYANVEEST